ncbi:MAG: coproporphyrinogen dehydrogenase HemZ [Clostridiales bacterium]|nr:coproporphyrinogen dehydrogenase HemZ [Clostridiales bacterium]
MTLSLSTNLESVRNELDDVVRVFFGDVTFVPEHGNIHLAHTHSEQDGRYVETLASGSSRCEKQAVIPSGELEKKRVIKRAAKTALFCLLKELTGIDPPWGSLTGIRPTRLMYEALEEGLTPDAAEKRLRDEFFVSPEKAALVKTIVRAQAGLIYPPEDSFDLYIHIPFCATRCAYCSFATGEVGDGKLIVPYVDALLCELKSGASLMRSLGLSMRAGYIGGGTPTAIPAAQLERILVCVRELFGQGSEFTVEAGRPDTITPEKLRMLKRQNVTRISVNPQTFSDETLRLIGRAHTGEDTLRAFALAREAGFDDINMDLIAALPGEDTDAFSRTIEKVISLRPESVTVHTLAVKRASRLYEQRLLSGQTRTRADARDTDRMLSLALSSLTASGYTPYYLYRQKHMAGNLENTGYCLPGKQCLYNIGNMEETQKVLAFGAGSISKWIFPRQKRIERSANLRNVEEYISRTDEMSLKKQKIILGEDANEKA